MLITPKKKNVKRTQTSWEVRLQRQRLSQTLVKMAAGLWGNYHLEKGWFMRMLAMLIMANSTTAGETLKKGLTNQWVVGLRWGEAMLSRKHNQPRIQKQERIAVAATEGYPHFRVPRIEHTPVKWSQKAKNKSSAWGIPGVRIYCGSALSRLTSNHRP